MYRIVLYHCLMYIFSRRSSRPAGEETVTDLLEEWEWALATMTMVG